VDVGIGGVRGYGLGVARRVYVALAALVFLGGCGVRGGLLPPFAAGPRLTAPALALVHDDPADNPQGFVALSLTGAGFGAAQLGGTEGNCEGAPFVEISWANEALRVPSVDRRVRLWNDTRVVVTIPPASPLSTVRLCTARGWTSAVAVDVYRYDHFALPPSPGTNPAPLALAIDARARVWINEEFHVDLKYFDSRAEAFSVLSIPRPPDPGPFALTIADERATQISQHGEAIEVDPGGRIWLSQGGGAPYSRDVADHSRIVAYDPDAAPGERFRVYNVPGDHNGVYGVAWDRERRRVWFAQAARQGPPPARETVLRARLTSFDPAAVASDGHFAFSPTAICAADGAAGGTCGNAPWRRCLTAGDCVLATSICAPGAGAEPGCYREYELPVESFVPAHVAVHPRDNSVWYASYWGGNHLGRLDPDSGELRVLPLRVPHGGTTCDEACDCAAQDSDTACRRCCIDRLFGVAPWDLAITATGDVAFSEYLGGAVGRLPFAAVYDPACASLDERGRNPCIDEVVVAPPGLRVHSIAVDRAQNVWFTQDGPMSDPAAPTSIGYVLADWRGHVLLPPLSLYPFFNIDASYCPTGRWEFVSFTGAGIVVDPSTQDVWFADYCRKRLGRLRRL